MDHGESSPGARDLRFSQVREEHVPPAAGIGPQHVRLQRRRRLVDPRASDLSHLEAADEEEHEDWAFACFWVGDGVSFSSLAPFLILTL